MRVFLMGFMFVAAGLSMFGCNEEAAPTQIDIDQGDAAYLARRSPGEWHNMFCADFLAACTVEKNGAADLEALAPALLKAGNNLCSRMGYNRAYKREHLQVVYERLTEWARTGVIERRDGSFNADALYEYFIAAGAEKSTAAVVRETINRLQNRGEDFAVVMADLRRTQAKNTLQSPYGDLARFVDILDYSHRFWSDVEKGPAGGEYLADAITGLASCWCPPLAIIAACAASCVMHYDQGEDGDKSW